MIKRVIPKGFLVGYCGEKNGFRVWLPKMNKIECSRNIILKPESIVQKRLELVVNSNINTGSNNNNSGDNRRTTAEDNIKDKLRQEDDINEEETEENDHEDNSDLPTTLR